MVLLTVSGQVGAFDPHPTHLSSSGPIVFNFGNDKKSSKIFFDNFPTPMTACIKSKLLFYKLFLRQFSFPNDCMAGGGGQFDPPPLTFFLEVRFS